VVVAWGHLLRVDGEHIVGNSISFVHGSSISAGGDLSNNCVYLCYDNKSYSNALSTNAMYQSSHTRSRRESG